MKYREIEDGIFLDRPNRFIAHVDVNGTVETVHCQKYRTVQGTAAARCGGASGSVRQPETQDKIRPCGGTQAGTWLGQYGQSGTQQGVGEWLSKQEFDLVRPEFPYGKSRIDFYMEKGEQKYLLEVKGCTLEVGGIGYFPDAPTERGVKHLHELAQAQRQGISAQ